MRIIFAINSQISERGSSQSGAASPLRALYSPRFALTSWRIQNRVHRQGNDTAPLASVFPFLRAPKTEPSLRRDRQHEPPRRACYEQPRTDTSAVKEPKQSSKIFLSPNISRGCSRNNSREKSAWLCARDTASSSLTFAPSSCRAANEEEGRRGVAGVEVYME